MKRTYIFTALIIVAIVSLFFPTQEAYAATKTWDGGGDGATWSDPVNWTGDTLPVSTDDIIIDGDSGTDSVVTLDIDFALEGSLTIDLGDKLIIDTGISLAIEGTIYNDGYIGNIGTINNDIGGIIDNSKNIINGNTINNLGTIENVGLIINYDTINNDTGGTINNDTGGIIENDETINNAGTINNLGTIENTGTIDNSGTIDNAWHIYCFCGTIFNNTGSFGGNLLIDMCPPIAYDDFYTILQNDIVSVSAPGILANDTDENIYGDALFVADYTQPDNGIVEVYPDGSFNYTPDTGFTGDDIFNYTISDGVGTDTAVVTITVNPSEPAETVKKLDLDVIQAPMKNRANYHIGASMDGLPVPVTLYSAMAIKWVKGQEMFSEDITSAVFTGSKFDGHLRVSVQNPDDCSFFQFVVVHDDNGTPCYGTCFVINEQLKKWPK